MPELEEGYLRKGWKVQLAHAARLLDRLEDLDETTLNMDAVAVIMNSASLRLQIATELRLGNYEEW